MVEEKITFQSDSIQIEGLLCVQDGKRGAVITHPHPRYGGSMYNKVVVAGDRDEIAPAHRIKDLIIRWNPEARLEIIEGADHFYLGTCEALHSVLSRAIG